MDEMQEVMENQLKDDTITCPTWREAQFCRESISKLVASIIYIRHKKGAAEAVP